MPVESTATQNACVGHETPTIAPSADWETCHEPAAGSFDVTIRPLVSPPMQSPATHDIAPIVTGGAGIVRDPMSVMGGRTSTVVPVQLLTPPEGSCERITMPVVSVAAHTSSAVHETAARPGEALGSIFVTTHEAVVVGSVETTAWPTSSTATQSVADAHEMPFRGVVPSTFRTIHVAVGSGAVMTLPTPSIATQIAWSEEQETPVSASVPSIVCVVHVVRSVTAATSACPASSTATQTVAVHETPVIGCSGPEIAGAVQVSPESLLV